MRRIPTILDVNSDLQVRARSALIEIDRDVASRLGVSVDHYRRLEAGSRGATETVARLVDALERSEPQAVVVDVVRDALRRRRGCFSGEDLGRLEEAFGRLRDRRGVRAAREALRLARVGDGRGDAP